MAIVVDPYLTVTLTFEDETGSRAPMRAHLPAATTLAAAQTRITALSTEIAGVSGCQLISWSISLGAQDNEPPTAQLDSRVERKGRLAFRTAAGKITSMSIPGFVRAGLTVDGRIQEDLGAVDEVVDEIVGGGWCDTNGSDIVSLAKAYERFRESTRPMLPSKRTPDADTDPAT